MMTPVASAFSLWTTSTTDSRKLGSSRLGLATRKIALGALCAWAAAQKTASASRAARRNRLIGFPGGSVGPGRGDGPEGPGHAGGHRPRAPEELLPELGRILAEYQVGVAVEHIPQAAVHFLAKLT